VPVFGQVSFFLQGGQAIRSVSLIEAMVMAYSNVITKVEKSKSKYQNAK